MRRHPLLSVVPVCVAIVALAGCGSTGQASGSKGSVTLTAPPALLTLRDVAQPPSSPQALVMRLLFYWQWGSVPNVIALYSPQAVDAVGTSLFSGVINYARPLLTSVRPQVSFTEKTSPSSYLVGISFLAQRTPATDESFAVRKVDGRWRVGYDTVTDRMLIAYVKLRGSSGTASTNALVVAERYRAASVGQATSTTFHGATQPSPSAGGRSAATPRTKPTAATRPAAATTPAAASTTTATTPGG